MQLESALQILFTSELAIADYIKLSSGIQTANDLKQTTVKYCDFAIVPKPEWQTPDEDTLSKLVGEQNSEHHIGSWIGLIKLPDIVLSILRGLLEQHSSQKTIQADPKYRSGLIEILRYLKPTYDNLDDLVIHNLAFKQSGLITSTYDDRRKCYIGMHLDSWEGTSFQDISSARNRICINLGRYPRYFLFYNLTLQDMLDKLDFSHDYLVKNHPNRSLGQAIGYTFMENYSEYPVLRLKIPPGYAYIAPTENIFHDGSTVDQLSTDISLTIRGYFRNIL